MSKAQSVKFYGTTFQTITGYATGVAVTGITNAKPAVVTSTAHGLTDNAIVKMAGVAGMTEVNGNHYVVNVLTADTFELLGTDATNYDAYTSGGTFALGTMSPTCQMTGSTHGSGSTAEITTETNCGISKSFGSPDDGQATFNFNYAPTSFVQALEESRRNVTETAVVTTMPSNAGIMIDIGVIITVGRDGSAGGVWTGTATMTRTQERIDLEV